MHICVYLWEAFLCQKVLCVLCILWELSPRLLVYERGSILPRNSRNSRNVRLRYWRRGYGRMPYPPNLCASVPICGRLFSARRFCVFCVFCGALSPRLLGWERVVFSHGIHGIHRMLGCVIGSVGMAGCHTLLICAYPCLSVGGTSLPECSVCSACSVGTLSLFALLVLQRQLHQRGSILPRISRISTDG